MAPTLPLPPCRGIFAVDTVQFTRNPSATQPRLSDAIPRLLGSAFTACGLTAIWKARRLPQGTGDGYAFCVPLEYTAFLLDPLLDQLQGELEKLDQSLRSEDRKLRLRLRVAINLGLVPDSGLEHEAIGTPVNDTFRLLDSDAIRRELETTSPDITFVAAIVSQRVFEDVVHAGFTPSLPPDRLQPVIAEVAAKGFAQPAWIYVPRPSRKDSSAPPGTEAQSEQPQGASTGTTIHGGVGNSISGGTFSENVKQDWRHTS